MKTISAIFTLLVALTVSAVAAYFSVVGLAALFAATFIPVVIMGTTLEIGKLVAVQWLHMNWGNPNVNFLHKTYKLLAIAALMIITSIGIYGFLSKGHLEQEAPIAGIELQIGQREQQIKSLQDANAFAQTKLTQLDKSIDSFLAKDKAAQGLRARNSQKAERAQIEASIQSNNEKIAKLNEEIVPLKMKGSEVTAKLGPIKYVAELFGWKDTNSAVRLVIGILMFAFDPFAIVMLISATLTFREIEDERKANKVELENNAPKTDEVVTSQVVMPEPQAEAVVEPEIEPVTETAVDDLTTVEPVLHIEHDDEHHEVDYAEDEFDDEFEDMIEDLPVEPAVAPVDPKDEEYREALRKFVHDAYRPDASVEVAAQIEPTATEKQQLIALLEKQPGLLDVMIEVISGYKPQAKVEIAQVAEEQVEPNQQDETDEQTLAEKTDQAVTEPRKNWL
jgi:hypothetical protein